MLKTAHEQVTVNDVVFNVEYNYSKEYRPATYYEPAVYPELEIVSVLLEGNEVIDLLSEWTIGRIIEQIEAPSNQEELEAIAEMRFEQMREQMLFKD